MVFVSFSVHSVATGQMPIRTTEGWPAPFITSVISDTAARNYVSARSQNFRPINSKEVKTLVVGHNIFPFALKKCLTRMGEKCSIYCRGHNCIIPDDDFCPYMCEAFFAHAWVSAHVIHIVRKLPIEMYCTVVS